MGLEFKEQNKNKIDPPSVGGHRFVTGFKAW